MIIYIYRYIAHSHVSKINHKHDNNNNKHKEDVIQYHCYFLLFILNDIDLEESNLCWFASEIEEENIVIMEKKTISEPWNHDQENEKIYYVNKLKE